MSVAVCLRDSVCVAVEVLCVIMGAYAQLWPGAWLHPCVTVSGGAEALAAVCSTGRVSLA